MNTRSPEDLIREAYSRRDGCPAPEAFLEEKLSAMTAEERAELRRHAESCPACAAERDLAAAFDASVEEIDAVRDELDPIVDSLEEAGLPGSDRSTGKVVALRARTGPRRLRWRGLAAAAVIAFAAVSLWLVTRTPSPGLPSIGAETAFRGTRIDVVGPVGDLTQPPRTLEWKPVSGASEYGVKLLAVDETVLWEATVSAAGTELPAQFLERMHPAVVYVWQVEARDSEGKMLARSERSSFRVRPTKGINSE